MFILNVLVDYSSFCSYHGFNDDYIPIEWRIFDYNIQKTSVLFIFGIKQSFCICWDFYIKRLNDCFCLEKLLSCKRGEFITGRPVHLP